MLSLTECRILLAAISSEMQKIHGKCPDDMAWDTAMELGRLHGQVDLAIQKLDRDILKAGGTTVSGGFH